MAMAGGSNNNPYNRDNETSWLDWRRLDTHRDAVRFTRLMIAFPQGASIALSEPLLAR